MPNWCMTTYQCVGSKSDITKLYNAISELETSKQPLYPNGFGKMWLGCLVIKLGYKWEDYDCRGEIIYFERVNPTQLRIDQETAWEEQKGVREVIENKFPSIKVWYVEEEPGSVIYRTNDAAGTYFPDHFLIDTHEGTEYFKTISDAAEYVLELTGRKPRTKQEIVAALKQYEDQRQNEDEDAYYSFHEFKIVKEGGEK